MKILLSFQHKQFMHQLAQLCVDFLTRLFILCEIPQVEKLIDFEIMLNDLLLDGLPFERLLQLAERVPKFVNHFFAGQ